MDISPVNTDADDPDRNRISGKRARTKHHNRHIILRAAKQVFASLGYEAATVRDIIHATPLASGTFYNYFKSKEDIYRAIYDEAAATIRPKLRAARRGAKSAEEFVRDTSHIYFDYIIREWKDFYRLRCNSESMRIRFAATEVVAAYDDLHGDITAAIKAGVLPPTDVDYLTNALIGISQEVAGDLLRRPNGDPAEAAEFVSRFILGGILAVPPPAPSKAHTSDDTNS